MSTGYLISVDPYEIANRFPDPSPFYEMENPDDPADSDLASLNYENEIEPILPKIPDREADLIEMYYRHKMRQASIAHYFGVTQAAVSYRLDRGIQRIKFLTSMPQLEEEIMRKDLLEVPLKNIDVDIMVGMWKTTCQSEVASRLNLTQGRVRHRFFGAVKALEKKAQEDNRFSEYSRVFSTISHKNFNVLRAVQLPQWSNRGGDSIG